MFRLTRIAALSLALAVASTACGGGSADPSELLNSGSRAMGSGDFAAALASFEQLDTMIGGDKSNALYMDTKKGLLQAMAGADPARAISSLSSMAGDLGDNLDVNLYSSVASKMSSAGHFDQAVEVMGLAKDRFGDSEILDTQAQQIIKASKAAGSDVSDAMAGLGYVGND